MSLDSVETCKLLSGEALRFKVCVFAGAEDGRCVSLATICLRLLCEDSSQLQLSKGWAKTVVVLRVLLEVLTTLQDH